MYKKQLEYILAIAEFQNITKAADHLFITRSALNYSLLNLERELGLPLFKRINNRLIPTAAGEVYLHYAKEIHYLLKECDTAMKDMIDHTQGYLNIGITPGYGQKIFSNLYPQFHKTYPQYHIQLYEGNAKQLYRSLHDGKIDFAWCAYHKHEQNLEHIILQESEVYLAVPRDQCLQEYDPSQTVQTVTADLKLYRSNQFVLMNKHSLIREISDIYFNDAGFTPQCLMECSLIDMTQHFTEAGIALSFIPAAMHKQHNNGILYFPLPKPETFALAISYRKGTFLTTAEQYFIDLIKQQFLEIVNQ